MTREDPPDHLREEYAPSIADVKAIQGNRGLGDDHVVWIGPLSFVIAHTNEERATIDLIDCTLHNWLVERDGPPDVPEIPGYYHVTETPVDGYSTSYRGDAGRWDWKKLEV